MDDGRVYRMGVPGTEKGLVIAPVMREVGSYENDVARMKAFDMVAHELSAAALVKKDQFHFGMVVPAVIDKGVPVFADAEGVSGSFGNF
jgi:hypothetical protein